MKLDARRVQAFLDKPEGCRVVLLHGDDLGLVRSRAETLVRAVAGSLSDPFRVVELDRDSVGALADEAASMSLSGGRRVVRMRDAADAAAASVKTLLTRPGDALVVLEAIGLTPRSKLRALIEGAGPDAVSIGCYPEEGRALSDTIRSVLAARKVRIEPEAVEWLTDQLGADRALTVQELEKLAVHAGPDGEVDLALAKESVGDLAGLSLDDALFAATDGDVATADRALELAIAEGSMPVGVLRAALLHMQRLHRARLQADAGKTAAEAAKAARPPVFFRQMPAFTRAVALWTSPLLASALDGIVAAENACKRTGAPDQAICRNMILTIARRARARAGAR